MLMLLRVKLVQVSVLRVDDVLVMVSRRWMAGKGVSDGWWCSEMRKICESELNEGELKAMQIKGENDPLFVTGIKGEKNPLRVCLERRKLK